MRFVALEGDDQALDLGGELVGIAHRPARAVAEGLQAVLLVAVEDCSRSFEAKASDIRGRARNIAARSNQLGKSAAAEMRALAGSVAVASGQSGFSCYDATLAERLRAAATQAEKPAELKLREAVFNEGPAGVANAVKNLWRNIGAYSVSLGLMSSQAGSRRSGALIRARPSPAAI